MIDVFDTAYFITGGFTSMDQKCVLARFYRPTKTEISMAARATENLHITLETLPYYAYYLPSYAFRSKMYPKQGKYT